MQHPRGNTGKPPQARDIIQIAQQGFGPQGTQPCHTGRAGGERQHLQAPSTRAALQATHHALPHIATPDDQQAFAAEARLQGAKGVLV